MFETRSIETAVTLETRSDNRRVLSGYAARFYSPLDPDGSEFELFDNLRERIRSTAFDDCLRKNKNIVGLWNHRSDAPIAATGNGSLKLSTDSRGLRFQMDVCNTSTGRDVLELVHAGILRGASFGFHVNRDSFEEADGFDVRWLEECNVKEISLATFPAYSGTEVMVG